MYLYIPNSCSPCTIACTRVKQILCLRYANIERAIRGCLGSVSSELYAKNIITAPVRDSQSYSKVVEEFESKFSLITDMSELKSHCKVFLECISQGGPTDDVVRKLAAEWGTVFEMEVLLPLPASSSFTPSPSPISPPASKGIIIIIINIIITQPWSYTVDDRLDMSLLIQWLWPLVDWKQFGLCLPCRNVRA